MSSVLLSRLFCGFLLLYLGDASANQNEDFDNFVNAYWSWRMEQSPEFATKVGIHLYNDRWQSLTEETFMKDKNAAEEFLARSEKINQDGLSEDDVITLKVVQTSLRMFISGYKYRRYTQYNPVTPLDYPSRDWQTVISRMPKKTVKDYLDLIRRYEGIETQINQFIALMRKAIELNTTQHEAALTGARERLEKLLTNIANNRSFFHDPLSQIPDGFSTEDRNNITEGLTAVIDTTVKTAIDNFKTFLLEEYLPHTRPLPGVSSLPGGADLYNECLRWHLDLNLTAQQVYDYGVSEVNRISLEIKKLMKEDNFTGNITEYLDYVKSKPENYYNSEEAMLDGYRDIMKVVHQRLDRVLPKITEDCPVIVKQNRNPLSWARYISLTDNTPGIFLINVLHPETRPIFLMTALTLHETEPGHHTQECYKHSAAGRQKARQVSFLKYYAVPFNFPFFTSFSEGWGLYAESLGEEMGVYDTSNKLLGRYLNEIFRAARLVVDTGIHYFGWSKDEAVRYLASYSTRREEDIINEINRYISWPGQACSYKIGEIRIKQLRSKAETKLGKMFDKRYFHEEILKLGSVPLSVLEDHIDKWIQKMQRQVTSATGRLTFVVLHVVLLPIIAVSLL